MKNLLSLLALVFVFGLAQAQTDYETLRDQAEEVIGFEEAKNIDLLIQEDAGEVVLPNKTVTTCWIFIDTTPDENLRPTSSELEQLDFSGVTSSIFTSNVKIGSQILENDTLKSLDHEAPVVEISLTADEYVTNGTRIDLPMIASEAISATTQKKNELIAEYPDADLNLTMMVMFSDTSGPGVYHFIIDEFFEEETSTGIEDFSVEKIDIYPNPAVSNIRVPGEVRNITISNNVGARLIEKQINQLNPQIDISDLNPGHYTVLVETKNGYRNGKFIKQ